MSDDNQSSFNAPKPGDDSSSPASTPAPDIDSRLEHIASRGFTPSQALGGSRSSGSWEPPTPEELQAQMPQYKVLDVLGRGGMGAVYKGWQTSLDRYVAIKILPPDLDGSDANFSTRFKQEAKTMARLSHPGIIPVYDAGETNAGLFYFVMEFVEGSDVSQMVRQQGKLQPDHALAITAHVCDALAYAHEHGVIHRDIKPANIMLNQEGQVKVADFGLAKSTELGANSGLTKTTMTVGTPDFIAPEALIMGVYSDHRADLYAVGVMLYNMLTGEIPRGRWKLPSEKVGSDVRFDAIINKAMETDREDRYQSAREIRRELNVIQSTPLEKSSPPMQQAAPARKPVMQGPQTRNDGTLAVVSVAKATNGRSAVVPQKSSAGIIMAIVGAVAIIGLSAFFIFKKPASSSSRREEALILTPGASSGPSASPGTATSQSLVTSAATITAATKAAPFVNTLGMKFVPVPITGGPTNGQRVLFSIWETRVQDYAAFAKETQSIWRKPAFEQGPDHPVVVCWEESQAFCSWLTERERKAGKLGANERYRLPSDHEWSCAVGIASREDADATPETKHERLVGVYLWGSDWPPPAGAGNYRGEELQADLSGLVIAGYRDAYTGTAPVGSFQANSLGIFDLGGNVWEFCQDWWSKTQDKRALRGASWHDWGSVHVKASGRTGLEPWFSNDFSGFRCVLDSLSAPTPATTAVTPPATPAPSPSTSLSPKQTIDLLALADPVRDRVQSSMGGANVWKKVGGVLSYETDGKSGKIAAPVGLLAKAYEIEVAFRRKAIGEIFNIDLPITDKVILPLEIGRDKNKIVMDGVAIGIWDSLASALSGRVVVRVEHVNENELKVTTWFDSKQTGQKTRWLSELIAKNSNESHPEFPGQPITTLWCAKDSYEFTSWVLRVFDGEAKVLRAAANTSTPTGRGEPTRAAPLETPPSDKSPATATKPSGRTVDLLPLVDVSKDGVSGAWSRQTDGVAVKASQASRLQLPYWPPTEYDFVLDFTVTKGSPDVAQILCAGGRNFVWKMGAANDGNEPPHPDWFGFEKVDGQNFRTNKTKTITPWKLENGVRHSAVVAVRKDGVTATVNGKEVIQFKTDLKNLSFQPAFALKDTRLLGFAAWDCDVTFHRAEVREISGQGFLTRSVPPAATDTSSPAATTQAATKDAPFVNTLGMKFVPVPITGGPTNGQRVLFSIWETRVQDYAAYATENPQIDMLWKNYALGKERQGPTHPVLCVGWKDGKAFCAWLKKKERAAGKLGNNLEYRLPSDHEWSCAVGIGEREDANASPKAKDNKKIAGIYPWGNFWPPTKGAGNYLSEGEGAGNAGGIKGYRDDYKFTAPVGSFAPTNQGLYDLGGNVWEWCEDMYESGRPDHVMRGGSWGADASDPDKLLSSRRGFNNDGRGVMNQYGFRCVLAPTSP